MVKKIYCVRILIEGVRFPPLGFDISETSSNSDEDVSFFKKTYWDRSLIESTRVPPFGFDIAEISLEASKSLGGNREATSILRFWLK